MEEGIATTTDGQVNTDTTGGVAESWFGGFPDELKGNELVSKHESSESMAKAYLETNTKYNELQTSLPTPPDSPDAYQFEIPADLEVDQARIDGHRELRPGAPLHDQRGSAHGRARHPYPPHSRNRPPPRVQSPLRWRVYRERRANPCVLMEIMML